jgi:hypothetical protein
VPNEPTSIERTGPAEPDFEAIARNANVLSESLSRFSAAYMKQDRGLGRAE